MKILRRFIQLITKKKNSKPLKKRMNNVDEKSQKFVGKYEKNPLEALNYGPNFLVARAQLA